MRIRTIFPERTAAILTVLLFGQLLEVTRAVAGGVPAVDSVRVESAIRDLVTPHRGGKARGDLYRDLPEGLVVRALTRAINTMPEFEDPGLRQRAYQILVNRQAGSYVEGFEQLLVGLQDAVTMKIALTGLIQVPPEYAPRTAEVIVDLLEKRTRDPIVFINLAHTISRLGQAADKQAARLQALSYDNSLGFSRYTTDRSDPLSPSDAPRPDRLLLSDSVSLRVHAMVAWSHSVGMNRFTEMFEPSDSVAWIGFLYAALRAVDSDRNLLLAADSSSKDRLGKLLMESLRLPEPSVREIAVRTVPFTLYFWNHKTSDSIGKQYLNSAHLVLDSLSTNDSVAAVRDAVNFVRGMTRSADRPEK